MTIKIQHENPWIELQQILGWDKLIGRTDVSFPRAFRRQHNSIILKSFNIIACHEGTDCKQENFVLNQSNETSKTTV